MMVLVDSSVWIEFFNPTPSISLSPLELLIQERQVATCLPIRAEVLSGNISPANFRILTLAFDAMDFVDLDWNSPYPWNLIVHMSQAARRKKAGMPGIIDRMILACCQEKKIPLWTLDKKLRKFALALKLSLFSQDF